MEGWRLPTPLFSIRMGPIQTLDLEEIAKSLTGQKYFNISYLPKVRLMIKPISNRVSDILMSEGIS